MENANNTYNVNILPVGADAVAFGVKFGFGFTCGVAVAVLIGTWADRIFNWLF